jgi:hypothetical protein
MQHNGAGEKKDPSRASSTCDVFVLSLVILSAEFSLFAPLLFPCCLVCSSTAPRWHTRFVYSPFLLPHIPLFGAAVPSFFLSVACRYSPVAFRLTFRGCFFVVLIPCSQVSVSCHRKTRKEANAKTLARNKKKAGQGGVASCIVSCALFLLFGGFLLSLALVPPAAWLHRASPPPCPFGVACTKNLLRWLVFFFSYPY